MNIKKYEELGQQGLDIIKEVSNIGTGYAATSLASLLDQKVEMTVPQINVLGYDETINRLGEAEECIAGVLTKMSGDINGIMLFILRLDFINVVLEKTLNRKITDYSELSDIEISAVTEIGNIIMSSYANAISMLSQMKIELSVPSVSVNMLGAILSVPMTSLGYDSDNIMLIDGDLVINSKKLSSNLLMLPDVHSLNELTKRLGGIYE